MIRKVLDTELLGSPVVCLKKKNHFACLGHIRASEARALVPMILALCVRYNNGSYHDLHRLLALSFLNKMYTTIMPSGHFLTQARPHIYWSYAICSLCIITGSPMMQSSQERNCTTLHIKHTWCGTCAPWPDI